MLVFYCKAQGFHPCTPLKGLLKKSLKNLQNFKKHDFQRFFKIFWSPEPDGRKFLDPPKVHSAFKIYVSASVSITSPSRLTTAKRPSS
jgi:hypothetical protein